MAYATPPVKLSPAEAQVQIGLVLKILSRVSTARSNNRFVQATIEWMLAVEILDPVNIHMFGVDCKASEAVYKSALSRLISEGHQLLSNISAESLADLLAAGFSGADIAANLDHLERVWKMLFNPVSDEVGAFLDQKFGIAQST